MQGQFTVDPAELDRAGAAFQQQAEATQRIKTGLEAIRLERGDFGYVPGLGNVCWNAYSEHVDACSTSLGQLSTSLTTLATTTLDTAADYRRTEQANLSYLKQLTALLNDDEGVER